MPYRTLNKKLLAKVKVLKGKSSYEVAALLEISQATAWRYQHAEGVVKTERKQYKNFNWV